MAMWHRTIHTSPVQVLFDISRHFHVTAFYCGRSLKRREEIVIPDDYKTAGLSEPPLDHRYATITPGNPWGANQRHFEINRTGRYVDDRQNLFYTEHVIRGSKMIMPELKKFWNEMRWGNALYEPDSYLSQQHGDFQMVYEFNDKKTIESWSVSADSCQNEGYSSAEFVPSKQNTGLFRGILITATPKSGTVRYAGYAATRSPVRVSAFGRKNPWDWGRYNCFVIKCRGDGRIYNLVLDKRADLDLEFLDRMEFPLYTHGGPYWQIAKIPFSRFIFTYKGSIQPKLQYLYEDRRRMCTIMIAVKDGETGPFQLEVDYIGVCYDSRWREIKGYEYYEGDYKYKSYF